MLEQHQTIPFCTDGVNEKIIAVWIRAVIGRHCNSNYLGFIFEVKAQLKYVLGADMYSNILELNTPYSY